MSCLPRLVIETSPMGCSRMAPKFSRAKPFEKNKLFYPKKNTEEWKRQPRQPKFFLHDSSRRWHNSEIQGMQKKLGQVRICVRGGRDVVRGSQQRGQRRLESGTCSCSELGNHAQKKHLSSTALTCFVRCPDG